MRLLIATIAVALLASGFVGSVRVSASNAGYISGPITEMWADLNDNGTLDEVVLLVPVVVNASGHWIVRGDISYNGVGASALVDTTYPSGTNVANLSFEGWRLRLLHFNGSYQVNLSAAQTDTGEISQAVYFTRTYAWTDFELKVELADNLAERPVDADADGLYDYLQISGSINVGVWDTYVIYANLYDSSGTTYIASTGNVSAYRAGYSTFVARFNGQDIRTHGIDGSYRLIVELMPFQGIDAYQRASLLTRSYTASQYYHNPIQLQGTITDSGLDMNADGKYDVLRVVFPLNVSIAGGYSLFGAIRAGCFGGVSASRDLSLPQGPASVPLDFDGFAIRSHCGDGPYTMDLSVTEDTSPFTIGTTYTTGFYNWRDFGNPYGLLGPTLTVRLVDADGDGLAEALQLDETIQVTAQATFEVIFSARIGAFDVLQDRFFVTADPGASPIRATFPGWRVRAIGYNGSYQFGVALRVNDTFIDDRSANAPYSWDQFQPAILLRGAATYATPDTDGDGLANRLDVSFPFRANVAGTYSFLLSGQVAPSATAASRYRYLAPGDVTVTLGLSGLLLRTFGGDVRLDLFVSLTAASFNESYQSVQVLTWNDTYPVPDPTVFQRALAATVTFTLRAPQPLLSGGTVTLWNATNALLLVFDANATVSLPEINFTAYAEGRAVDGNAYAAVVALQTPLPSAVNIDLSATGGLADAAYVGFHDWSGASAWSNRSLPNNPGARFFADLNFDPDDVLTREEVENLFLATPSLGPPAIRMTIDGFAVATGSAGPDLVSGTGPVIMNLALGLARPLSLSAAPQSDPRHVVAVTLGPKDVVSTSVMAIRWPAGWVLEGADLVGVVRVTGRGLPEARIEVVESSFFTYTVNLTVVPVSLAYGSIQGLVLDNGTSPSSLRSTVSGATLRLFDITVFGGSPISVATSRSDGTFVMTNIPPGDYRLEASANGYVTNQVGVAVLPFQTVDIGEIALTRSPVAGPDVGLLAIVAGAGGGAVVAVLGVLWYLRRKRMRIGPGEPPTGEIPSPRRN